MDHPQEADQAEARLVEKSLQGEQSAWAALVNQHQAPIFRLAYLFLGDEDDAQDIAQEAFIRAYQHLQRFDRRRPLRPWLLSITANLSKNRRRALSRYFRRLTRLQQRQASQPVTSVEERSEANLAAEALWQAVRSLNEADQEVIYLRYFLDLSVQETALTLQVAEGTVKSRLHRALNRLRNVIKADFPLLVDQTVYE